MHSRDALAAQTARIERLAYEVGEDVGEDWGDDIRRVITTAGREALRRVQADVWDEAYMQGAADEHTSQEYDGGATPPARVNPYRAEASDA